MLTYTPYYIVMRSFVLVSNLHNPIALVTFPYFSSSLKDVMHVFSLTPRGIFLFSIMKQKPDTKVS
jgi:hypothetical protein